MKQRKEWLSPGKDPTPRAKPNCTNERLCRPSGRLVRVLYIHFELLPNNQTITAIIYVEQLLRLASAVPQKRQKKQHAIMLQHDNALPDTAIITKTAIQELGWEVLPSPGYSPDLAPADYHLFRSLAINLRGVSFNNDENVQKWLSDFFSSKPPHFYRLGIEQVASRWKEVVNSEGEYIVD
ncbi:hypothetical protein M514_08588 [Trichuris suis]|uniref:Mos1 transposase HTH domain-containing protein n=1 Tax=Trichuris suis TaxID=68888 RepID=A0A085N1W1_9BILA|nr:hypothetical protein M514_08588 [Trichuris suis]